MKDPLVISVEGEVKTLQVQYSTSETIISNLTKRKYITQNNSKFIFFKKSLEAIVTFCKI